MNQFWKVKSNPEAVEKPLQNPFCLWERTFWAALLTIYKSFLLFMIVYLTVCSIQCRISNYRSYQKFLMREALCLESLKSRRWYINLCLLFELKKKHPPYLFDIIPKVLSTRTTRNHNNIPLFNVKHEYFKNSFFSSTVIECN